MERNAAIDRVLKLSLVTEERGATAGEASNARSAAERLIARHGLTLAEVETVARGRRPLRPGRRPMPPPFDAYSPPVATTGTGTYNNPGGFTVWIRFT